MKYRDFHGFQVAEEKSYLLCKWFTLFMMIFFTIGTWSVVFVMSLWSIYQGDYDSSNWFLPYRIVLPIDTSKLLGFFWQFILEAASGYAYVLTITSTVTLFGGCSYYLEGCLNQFKYMYAEIDKSVEKNDNAESIEDKIFETVVLHNKIFDVFDIVADIYSAAIFWQLGILYFSFLFHVDHFSSKYMFFRF